MPGGDTMPAGRQGTGPFGEGPRTGRGLGRTKGQGRIGGNRQGAGPGGDCICPSCGIRIPHQPGTPCSSLNCPKCASPMIRG